jgi:hypothetical protein
MKVFIEEIGNPPPHCPPHAAGEVRENIEKELIRIIYILF